jgi:hypothetical protein
VSGGARFFLKKELTDLLQKLRLNVLPFIAGRTRTYGDEVASAAETANTETTSASVATAAASTTTTARVTRRSVVVVATGRFGGDDPNQGCRQALQQDELYLENGFRALRKVGATCPVRQCSKEEVVKKVTYTQEQVANKMKRLLAL